MLLFQFSVYELTNEIINFTKPQPYFFVTERVYYHTIYPQVKLVKYFHQKTTA